MAWFSKPFNLSSDLPSHPERKITLHNTLGNSDETFTMPHGKEVHMYNCGPTVYGPAHIGNLRSYIFADTIRRTLEYNGFPVKQIINITDVGHLSSDEDAGEDKMSKGLKREGLKLTLENMHKLAEKYTDLFISDIALLNIKTEGTEFPRASEYIDAQIAMIQTLEEKGYAYRTSDGIYYDTSRFPAYGALGNIDVEKLKEGARVEANPEKHNPVDFNLWKFDEKLGWKSPWGQGFPGWHIECSAMSRTLLGDVDIHTGGIDHIPVHHNNEIAQSEAVTGKKPFVRYWMHNEFINVDEKKISKSLNNGIILAELPKHGLHPLALRYLYLGARYRSPINFSWEALKSSQQALLRLHFIFNQLDESDLAEVATSYQKRFHECINDDLDTPGALAVVWELLKDDTLPPASIRATLLDFDLVLGLSLANTDDLLEKLILAQFGEVIPEEKLSQNLQDILKARDSARDAKDWQKADTLRLQIESLGYRIEDTPSGARILRKEVSHQE